MMRIFIYIVANFRSFGKLCFHNETRKAIFAHANTVRIPAYYTPGVDNLVHKVDNFLYSPGKLDHYRHNRLYT